MHIHISYERMDGARKGKWKQAYKAYKDMDVRHREMQNETQSIWKQHNVGPSIREEVYTHTLIALRT